MLVAKPKGLQLTRMPLPQYKFDTYNGQSSLHTCQVIMKSKSASEVVTRGNVRADGGLDLKEPLNLPPGEVEVTVTPVTGVVPGSVWDRLDDIWQSQQARGHLPRSPAEIDQEIQSLRNEWADEANANSLIDP